MSSIDCLPTPAAFLFVVFLLLPLLVACAEGVAKVAPNSSEVLQEAAKEVCSSSPSSGP